MQKKFNQFVEYIKEYLDILVLVLNVFIIELIIRNLTKLGFGKLPILFDLLILSILIIVLVFLKRKSRLIIEFIITLAFSIYGFAQSLHYAFFTTFFSFKKLTVINELNGVFNEVFSKVTFKYLLFLLPIIIFGLNVYLFRKKERKAISIKVKIVIALVFGLFIGANALIVRNALKNDALINGWQGDEYLLDTFHNNVRFYDRFGIFEYFIKDVTLTLNQHKTIKMIKEDMDALDRFIDENHYSQVNEMTGKYKGKNLILILCESLNYYGINEELTPTLYNISENGYFFTNNYAPIYQSATGDSEFISLTSMIPSVDYGTTSYTYFNNLYPYSLPSLLAKEGYQANSYHSYISNFYNRELFHQSLGFETFFDDAKLGIYRQEDIDGFNWPNDDILFNRTIANTKYDKGPFFDFVITTSGHMPYVTTRDELVPNLEKIEKSSYNYLDEESKCYLAAQMNLDKGLAQLIEDLEAIGELEDTIIVLYGDHYPYGISTQEAYDEVIKNDDYRKYKTPLIIYDPSLTQGVKIDKLTSTFDIYPTIANLFGLDYSGAYTVGNDVFSSSSSYVPFMDRSILTDDFYYDSLTNETTILSDNYSNEALEAIQIKVRDIFEKGQMILKANYYGKD